MSFLFKVVLGQRVVHPSSRDGEGAGDAQTPVAEPRDNNVPTGNTAAAAGGGSSRTVNGGRNEVSSAAPISAPASASPTAQQEKVKPPSSSASSPYRDSASRPSPPRPSTPTRTLLLRIEGCTVAQDLRDAIRDLLRCPDLPYALETPSLRSLLSLLANYPDDETITEPTLQLLAYATDIDVYPDQLESNRRVITVTPADKRHTRDALLQPLAEAVPLLLDSMKATAPFWNRCHVVTLLQRLEEYEPSKVNQALLAARGIGALLDALNENEHEHQLRNQALVLLTSLTLADPELQTLLAFDNAFDSLFDLIQREGGVQRGGATVRDSLTVVHNMLRSNKATQKFFREMGCAARLAALFDAMPAELGACTAAEQPPNIIGNNSNSGGSSPSPTYAQPAVLTEKLEAFLESAQSSDAMLNVLLSVSILACVLRGSDEAEAELRATQDALLRCGLLSPLTRLAFCGLAIDDATRIEAVRVLALLLSDSKRAIEELLSLPPVVTLVRATLPYTVRTWPTPRALLSYVCETTDTTLVSAAVQLFSAVLSVPACQERAVAALLDGLVDVSGGGGAGAAARPPKSQNGGGAAASGGAAQVDTLGGAALARVLLSARTSALEKYYAAQFLRALMVLPSVRNVSQALVQAPVPPLLQSTTLAGLVKAQPGWALSAKLPASFYNYVVTFLLFCLGGGAAAQQVNTAALGAYVGALLAWMAACPLAAAALVEETAWGEALLHQARRDGAAHLRLWSAVLIASSAVVTTRAAAAGAVPASATAAAKALTLRFLQMVGSGAALDAILFDAQASTPVWQHPVASGLRTQNPSPCDEALVAQVEQLATEFKQLLGAAAGSAPPGAVPMPPLVRAAAASPTMASPPLTAATAAQPDAAPPSSVDHSSTSSRDYRVEEPHLPPPQQISASSAGSHPLIPPTSPVADPHVRTMLGALQAELAAAKAERAGLAQALHEWQTRAEQSAAQCAAMEEEQNRRAAAAAECERRRAEEAATSAAQPANTHAASADVVEGLRENIRLLEEALSSKEEEHQQLVESLNMMEEQLRHASQAAAQRQQQQLQLQEEREAHRACQAEVPPPPPPPPQPAPEVVEALEAERNAMLEQLALTQQETARMQQALRGLSNDYSELLVMVAELNDECVSVKGGSSMAVTPARPWQHDGTSSLERTDLDASLLDGHGRKAERAVYDADMTTEALFDEAAPPLAHAPQPLPHLSQVSGLHQPASMTAAAQPPLTYEPSWDAGTLGGTYEEATDVTIDTTTTPTAAQHATAPPQKQSASPELLLGDSAKELVQPHSSLSHVEPPSAPSPPPLPQPVPHVTAAPPGPPPPPLPHAAQHPLHRSALGIPRYADPSMAVYGAAPSAPATAPSPPHGPPPPPPSRAPVLPGPPPPPPANAHQATSVPLAHPSASPPPPPRQPVVSSAPVAEPAASLPQASEVLPPTLTPQQLPSSDARLTTTWQPSVAEVTTTAAPPLPHAGRGGGVDVNPFAADSDDDGDVGNGVGGFLHAPVPTSKPLVASLSVQGAAAAHSTAAPLANHQPIPASATQVSTGTETVKLNGAPATAFNPFAELNSGDDGDEFGDLR